MAKYTTRVELHNAKWSDYELLHKEMIAQGFTNVIQSNDGVKYQLPPAEYNYEGSLTRHDVLERARGAARAIKSSFALLVTESSGRSWEGLKRID